MTIDLQFNNMKSTLRKDIGEITVQVKISQIVDSVTVKQVTAMYTEQNHEEIVGMSPYWIRREWHFNPSIEKKILSSASAAEKKTINNFTLNL